MNVEHVFWNQPNKMLNMRSTYSSPTVIESWFNLTICLSSSLEVQLVEGALAMCDNKSTTDESAGSYARDNKD